MPPTSIGPSAWAHVRCAPSGSRCRGRRTGRRRRRASQPPRARSRWSSSPRPPSVVVSRSALRCHGATRSTTSHVTVWGTPIEPRGPRRDAACSGATGAPVRAPGRLPGSRRICGGRRTSTTSPRCRGELIPPADPSIAERARPLRRRAARVREPRRPGAVTAGAQRRLSASRPVTPHPRYRRERHQASRHGIYHHGPSSSWKGASRWFGLRRVR